MLSHRFEEAFLYAARLHASQRRKGTEVPYIAHLMGVAGIALDFGADEDEAVAALLHDAVEDQGGMPVLEEIRRRFGERVAEIVLGCSDSWTTPKPPWKQRKQDYLRRLPRCSASAHLVSAADKLYNVQAILRDHRKVGEDVWRRFSAGPEDLLWYYGSLAAAFREHGDHPLFAELDRLVAELRKVVAGSEPGS